MQTWYVWLVPKTTTTTTKITCPACGSIRNVAKANLDGSVWVRKHGDCLVSLIRSSDESFTQAQPAGSR